MVKKAYIPEKGDIIWLNFSPQSGHEQGGKRPALVLSPKIYNAKTHLAICCPITSQIKGYPFEIILPTSFTVQGAILADHVKSLDWKARKAGFIANLPSPLLSEVFGKLKAIIG